MRYARLATLVFLGWASVVHAQSKSIPVQQPSLIYQHPKPLPAAPNVKSKAKVKRSKKKPLESKPVDPWHNSARATNPDKMPILAPR